MDFFFLPFQQESNKILLGNDISGGIPVEKKLLNRIEELRKKLNKFALNRDLIDSEVVEVSQQLDSLLNQYQRLVSYKQLSFW
jgi:Spo0E like sporulation regulatory protein.